MELVSGSALRPVRDVVSIVVVVSMVYPANPLQVGCQTGSRFDA